MGRKKGTQHHPDQEIMFAPECDWRAPNIGELPSWAGAKRIAVDVETYDPDIKTMGPGVRRDGYVVGYSFAIEDGPSAYVPIAHAGGDNVEDPTQAVRYLRDQAKNFGGVIVGANLPYDIDYLAEMGVEFSSASWFRDVQIADPLIYELHQHYTLEAIAQRLGLPGKDETLLREAAAAYGVDPKGGMWRLPARYVGAYGEQDVRLPLAILRRQERLIEEQDLQGVFDLESRLLPVLVRVTRRGIRVDEDRLEQIERWSLEQEAEALSDVYRLVGVRIEVGDTMKASALAPALEKAGVFLQRTSTSQPNIDKMVLASCGHPVGEALARARKVAKLRTTFAASVRRYLVNGRIHANINQMVRDDGFGGVMGARPGRMSMNHPNMQQQPSRDEFAARWRSIYLAEDGALIAADDYSQQEPRLMAHYAEIARCPGGFEAAERYRVDPNTDSHAMTQELTGLERKDAKIIYLGRCYGMGDAKMARSLGFGTRWAVRYGPRGQSTIEYFATPTEAEKCKKVNGGFLWETADAEAAELIERFDRGLPYVKKLSRKCRDAAEERGYIITLLGRQLHFPKSRYAGQTFGDTQKALNRLIQGSAADQTKKAMVEADAEGVFLQLQVHDELIASVPDEGAARQLARIMSDCVELRVPSKVDVAVGPSWGEAQDI